MLDAIVDAIVERDIPGAKIVGISQGWKLTGAIKTTERKLAEGALCTAAQPLMAWCVGNAKVEPRATRSSSRSRRPGTAKIDPLMALFNAVR
jgi:phage terminase large subunit-like protein